MKILRHDDQTADPQREAQTEIFQVHVSIVDKKVIFQENALNLEKGHHRQNLGQQIL